MRDQWCRYCWTMLYLENKPFIIMCFSVILNGFWLHTGTYVFRNESTFYSDLFYFDSSPCNWTYFKVYLKC